MNVRLLDYKLPYTAPDVVQTVISAVFNTHHDSLPVYVAVNYFFDLADDAVCLS